LEFFDFLFRIFREIKERGKKDIFLQIIKRARKEKTEIPSKPVIKQSMSEMIIDAEYQAYQQLGASDGDNFLGDANFHHNAQPQELFLI